MAPFGTLQSRAACRCICECSIPFGVDSVAWAAANSMLLFANVRPLSELLEGQILKQFQDAMPPHHLKGGTAHLIELLADQLHDVFEVPTE